MSYSVIAMASIGCIGIWYLAIIAGRIVKQLNEIAGFQRQILEELQRLESHVAYAAKRM